MNYPLSYREREALDRWITREPVYYCDDCHVIITGKNQTEENAFEDGLCDKCYRNRRQSLEDMIYEEGRDDLNRA